FRHPHERSLSSFVVDEADPFAQDGGRENMLSRPGKSRKKARSQEGPRKHGTRRQRGERKSSTAVIVASRRRKEGPQTQDVRRQGARCFIWLSSFSRRSYFSRTRYQCPLRSLSKSLPHSLYPVPPSPWSASGCQGS